MKKLYYLFLAIILAGMVVSCKDVPDGYEFEEGWYKYDDDTSVVYIEYNSSEVIERAGTVSDEYNTTQLAIAKDTFNYSSDSVRQYLTKIVYGYNLPTWIISEMKLYQIDEEGKVTNIEISDGAEFDDGSNNLSITVGNVGDSITFYGSFYLNNVDWGYNYKPEFIVDYPEGADSYLNFNSVNCYNSSDTKELEDESNSGYDTVVIDVKSLPEEDTTYSIYLIDDITKDDVNGTYKSIKLTVNLKASE